MNKKLKILTNGFIRENPLLVLNIGLCSSLGVTTSIFNGLGMGMGMTFVLLMSEIVISLFRKRIPSSIRLPVFIIIIAAFTTIVQLFLNAYVESLYDALGVFLPLIVVNCIIMGRVEAFASKNTVGDSALDALGMGIGYTCVLVLISFFRELLGGGTLMSGTAAKLTIIPEDFRIGIFNSAPGGFMVFGLLAAAVQAIKSAVAKKQNKPAPKVEEPDCGACKAACPAAGKIDAVKTENCAATSAAEKNEAPAATGNAASEVKAAETPSGEAK